MQLASRIKLKTWPRECILSTRVVEFGKYRHGIFKALFTCYGILRPVQTGNVWRLNIIKHCLMIKHAVVEVSGQTRVKNTDQIINASC